MDKEIVKIYDMDGTKGIGKIYDKIVFVENGLLGEEVLVDVTSDKGSYFIGEKIDVINESPYKVESKCPFFPECDGCSYQNLDYKKEVDLKKNQIVNNLRRIGKIDIDEIDFIEAKSDYFYRNKLSLKVDEKGVFSFYNSKNHNLINIKSCNIGSKKINDLIVDLQKLFDKHGLKGFSKENLDGIKGVTIRDLGDVMVIIEFNDRPSLVDEYIEIFNELNFDSLYFSFNRKNFGLGRVEHISGKESLDYNLLGYKFKVSPKSFLQVNKYMTEEIYLKAIEYLKKVNSRNVLDLYSGTGTISILISQYVNKVVGIEQVKSSVIDAKENAKINKIENVSFLNERVENSIYKVLRKNIDTIIFDPPRRGIDQSILKQIIKADVNNIIYISCNPSTLARDIGFLRKNGYDLLEVCGIDNFSKTNNVETVTLITKEKK